MGKTKIEWADKVWNPTVGCTPVSAGCAHCYARTMFNRFYNGKKFSDIQLFENRLMDALRWKKPRRIFVNSMSDLFHPDVPTEFIAKVFSVMAIQEKFTFMVLTKRPERMFEILSNPPGEFRACLQLNQLRYRSGKLEQNLPLSNVWLGVTAENQKIVEERIPLLLQTPAAKRFVSVEPMLGPVDIKRYFPHNFKPGDPQYGWERQCSVIAPDGLRHCGYPPEEHPMPGVDWVILGCESGPKARPMNPAWVYPIKNQCVSNNVPFFLKQMNVDGKLVKMPKFDGRIWNEVPE
jgi:protein gp37